MQRLDMNITRAQFDCFFKEIIDGADHRRTAGKIPQTLDVVFARLERFKAALNLDIPAAQTLIERNCDIFKRRHLNRDIGPEHDFGGAPLAAGSATASPAPRWADRYGNTVISRRKRCKKGSTAAVADSMSCSETLSRS